MPSPNRKVGLFSQRMGIFVALYYDEIEVALEGGRKVLNIIDRQLGEKYEVAPGAVIGSSESLSFGCSVTVETQSGKATYRGELASSKEMQAHVDRITALLDDAHLSNDSIHRRHP